LLSLLVILACRLTLGDEAFKAWGWRIPFLTSIVLLAVSVYIRLKLEESPVFQKLQLNGGTSKSPIREAFGSWGNVKSVLVCGTIRQYHAVADCCRTDSHVP
jgi:hypothetical protein